MPNEEEPPDKGLLQLVLAVLQFLTELLRAGNS